MTQTTLIDKTAETYREKILRKCAESVAMKEKFFTTYAGPIEAMAKEMARRFHPHRVRIHAGMGKKPQVKATTPTERGPAA